MSDKKAEYLRLLEALLFASSEPLSITALHERMPDDADVGGLLLVLQETYNARGVHLTERERMWAFRTAPDLADVLELERSVQKKLSRAAMETMAIIAYHQPVTRAEIENIRGVVTHKGTIDVLLEAGWVKPGRRRETPGRPLTWVTSSTFLDQFSLETLTDLPGLDDLKASGLLDRRPAIETVPTSDDLFAGQEEEEEVEEPENADDDFEDEIVEEREEELEEL